MDHHWGPYTPVDPIGKFRNSEGAEVCLNGYQYAWVGDGYGLNHVASSTDGTKKYLLGYVIHLKDEKLEQEVVRRPHVGVIDGTDRLIWLTKSEVFFEEMIRGRGDVPDRYYIRGFRYSIDEVKRELSASEAFQVVYSRKADKREPWRGFKIKLLIK